jgi:hypothetical protein
MNQTAEDYEIICVNDGSTDGSLEILERMQSRDARIKVVSQENQGLSVARNTGLRHARGKYVMFCDSDDMYKVDSLKRLYTLAEENRAQIVFYDAKCVYMTEQLLKKDNKDWYYQRAFSYGLDNGKELFARMMENNNFCDSACLMFINRNWLKENDLDFYTGILYEDCLFSVQCLMKADRVYHINEQFYIYRVRENSIMTSGVSAKNLYGRLVNLYYFTHFLYTEEFTEKQEWALVEFSECVQDHAKRLAQKLSGSETENLLQMPMTQSMRMILEQVGVSQNKVRKSGQMAKMIDLLDKADNIEIYGAGVRGKRLLTYLFLNSYGDKVRNFVVSTRENQNMKMENYEIAAVDEGWKPSKDKLLIIAISGEAGKEIYNRYQRLGETKLLYLDATLCQMISQNIRKKLMI